MKYKTKQNKYTSESEDSFNHALSIFAEEIGSVSNIEVNNQIANNYKKTKIDKRIITSLPKNGTNHSATEESIENKEKRTIRM